MYTFSLNWRINDVPITCYLMTHAYFIFYHSLTNLVLRRLRRALAASSRFASFSISALTILALAYVTAFMETFTISNFPYYSFENRHFAYTIGSAFYAIYFVVSFPMFLRIDEEGGSSRSRCPPPHAARAPSHSGSKWPLSRVAIDALASAMLVTIMLDTWRLVATGAPGLPWVAAGYSSAL
jgi:cycloeucalenol cycloisomerase